MIYSLLNFSDPLEEGETIYSAAFEKENKKAEDKYPSSHQTESKKGSASPRNVPQKVKKAPKPAKPAPLAGIQQKIEKVCYNLSLQYIGSTFITSI